ncbi:HNH endonuclease [Akkermansiaceae bacterium]|nr:HNH endonuclease [Akkermansiaceae bacterium]
MISSNIELLASTILATTGAEVFVEPNYSGKRSGLDAWFYPWEKREGPIFSIKPYGLKRHAVRMSFGKSSRPCIARISRRSREQKELARAMLSTLEDRKSSMSTEISAEVSWYSERFCGGGQQDDQELIQTARLVMVPMIAAMAELIGFEEVSITDGEVEGRLSKALVLKRERNSRNRLLALRLHGYRCGVCDLCPKETFGEALGGILEVHHIEPLSSLGEPRPYDPMTDLIPLCPNCHRMIHKENPPLTPDKLREIIRVDYE